MRGAPHIGFFRLMQRISSRVSLATAGLPLFSERTFHVQKTRNSLLCSRPRSPAEQLPAMTASQSTVASQIQNRRSTVFSFSLFDAVRCNTETWWRRAMFFICKTARAFVTECNPATTTTTCRTTMASTSAMFSSSHHRNEFGVYGMNNPKHYLQVPPHIVMHHLLGG